MLLSLRRLPLSIMMAKKFSLSYQALPVMLFTLAAASVQLSAAFNDNGTSAIIAAPHNSSVTRYPNVQYLSNASASDNGVRSQFQKSDNLTVAGCKNCGVKQPPEKGSVEYQLRIMMIKRQILDKLHMDREPQIKRPTIPIPSPLETSNFLENPRKPDSAQDIDRGSEKVSKVIVIGTKVASSANRLKFKKTRKQVFEFRFSRKVYSRKISSAMLWIYKRRKTALIMGDHTLKFSSVSTSQQKVRQQEPVVKKSLTSSDPDWISINILTIAKHWVEKALKESMVNSTNYAHRLEIACPDCSLQIPSDVIASRGRFKPFVTLNLENENARPRKKRAVNCRPQMKECCRQEFYVSFREMGWNNWIVAPHGFNANFCTGSCFGRILPVYHHTEVLQKVAMLKKQRDLSPCCSPIKMFGLSLIYFDKEENLFHEEVPNMVVEECGCS